MMRRTLPTLLLATGLSAPAFAQTAPLEGIPTLLFLPAYLLAGFVIFVLALLAEQPRRIRLALAFVVGLGLVMAIAVGASFQDLEGRTRNWVAGSQLVLLAVLVTWALRRLVRRLRTG